MKPNLFNLLENNNNYEINLGIITYKTSEDMKTENSKEMNSYFNVKKIPYLEKFMTVNDLKYYSSKVNKMVL